MTQPLKDAVKEHVESKTLSESQLQVLEGLMNQAPEANETPANDDQKKHLPRVWMVFVACIMVGFGAFWWSNQATDINKLDAIALEVAKNHLKLKPLEVKANQVQGTQHFFTKLNFKLIADSDVIKKQTWQLQGGRYCSIQGEDAAQLRYSAGKKTVSVYMAPYIKDVMGQVPNISSGAQPAKVSAKGIDVWIWVERGVLMAATPNG